MDIFVNHMLTLFFSGKFINLFMHLLEKRFLTRCAENSVTFLVGRRVIAGPAQDKNNNMESWHDTAAQPGNPLHVTSRQKQLNRTNYFSKVKIGFHLLRVFHRAVGGLRMCCMIVICA